MEGQRWAPWSHRHQGREKHPDRIVGINTQSSGLTLLWSQSISTCLSAGSNRTWADQELKSHALHRCCRLPRRHVHSTLPGLWSGPLTSHEWMSGLVGVLLEGDVSPWQLASPSNTAEWSCQDSGFLSLVPHHHSDLVGLSPWLNPFFVDFLFF